MANTYTLIASNTLSSSAASVTFSSIPNTYTDLLVKWSARTALNARKDLLCIEFNGLNTNLSFTRLDADDGGVFSGNSTTRLQVGYVSANTATANTFGNGEFYIPSYNASQNKPVSGYGVAESNSNLEGIEITAGLWRNTAAVTQIRIFSEASSNLQTGSSFFLYGIKNS